jgi:hypothetical protein
MTVKARRRVGWASAMGTYAHRTAYACVLTAAVLLVVLPRDGEAAEPVAATMQCEQAAEPGRVRCSVDVRAEERSIAWADVVILQLPEIASALKGRLGPLDAAARDDASVKWAFALVARKAGQGEVRARVRVVVCEGGEGSRCVPMVTEVRAMISVG